MIFEEIEKERDGGLENCQQHNYQITTTILY
jgi:hypothetical protein